MVDKFRDVGCPRRDFIFEEFCVYFILSCWILVILCVVAKFKFVVIVEKTPIHPPPLGVIWGHWAFFILETKTTSK
jgi:hypothetical protein